jgi:tetratricopeptide (TPR) repeat protein
MHWAIGDYSQTRKYLEGALELRGGADDVTRAELLIAMGWEAAASGDLDVAASCFAEAVSLRASPASMVRAAGWQAMAVLEQGRLIDAAAMLELCGQFARESNDRYLIAIHTGLLSQLMLRQGDFDGASTMLREGLSFMQSVGGKTGTAQAFRLIGELGFGKRLLSEAARLVGASDKLTEDIGQAYPVMYAISRDRLAGWLRDGLAENYGLLIEEGRDMSEPEAVALAHRVLEAPITTADLAQRPTEVHPAE